MATKNTPIDVEIHYQGDKITLVVPKQAGLAFADAAPRLAAFAASLSAELGLPIEILDQPEQHLHGPEVVQQGQGTHQHAH